MARRGGQHLWLTAAGPPKFRYIPLPMVVPMTHIIAEPCVGLKDRSRYFLDGTSMEFSSPVGTDCHLMARVFFAQPDLLAGNRRWSRRSTALEVTKTLRMSGTSSSASAEKMRQNRQAGVKSCSLRWNQAGRSAPMLSGAAHALFPLAKWLTHLTDT